MVVASIIAAAILGAAWRRLFRKRSFCRPPALQSSANSSFVDAKTTRPAGNTYCFATESEKTIGTSVVLLLFHRCPAAVAGFVVLCSINSIDRVLRRWTLAHVGKKMFKLPPALADADAPPSVIIVIVHGRASATTDHRQPCFVGWLPMMTVPAISRRCAPRAKLSAEASARFRMPIPQIFADDDTLHTALTNTMISDALAHSLGASYDGPAFNFLSLQIGNKLSHGGSECCL